MQNLSTPDFVAKANRLIEYFKYNAESEDDIWSYGLKIAETWRRLVINTETPAMEVKELLNELKNAPEPQCTAYSELEYFVSLWAKTKNTGAI